METMGDDIFLDTNILVYALISESPFHLQASQKIERLVENQACLGEPPEFKGAIGHFDTSWQF